MVEIPVKAARKCLSSDCWERVFSYLEDEDLKAVSLTCKDFLAYSNPLKRTLKVVHPQIGMLSRLLNRFTHLKAIDLLEFEGNEEEAIREIACSTVRLEALHTKSLRHVSTFHGYYYVFEEVSQSELLSNSKACSFIAEISNRYPNLEQLRFECSTIGLIPSGSGLELLASKLKLLKRINVTSSHVSDEFIDALSFSCVFLKEVTVLSNRDRDGYDQGGVTENAIGQLLQNRPNLEALWIECIVRDVSVSLSRSSSLFTIEASISHAKALTSLVVRGMSNTDKVLMAIAKAKLPLNNLGLLACRDLSVSGLLMVLSNHLTKLRIERARLRDEDVEVLVLNGDVSKLTHIEIKECHVTESILFLLLTQCPSLVDIRVIFPMLKGRIQNEYPLSIYHKIQSLCLARCYVIGDTFVKHLGCLFPNLKVLDLGHCVRITSTSIEAILKSCKHVTKLNLAEFRGAKMIADDNSEFPKLNLEVLNLSCSEIDDEGLAIMAKKCPRLVSLDLNRCYGITTEGVKRVVESIKSLTCLNLMHSGNNDFGALLEWMLSTGNLASLKRIFLCLLCFESKDFFKEQRDRFLQHGCLLLTQFRQ